MLPKFKFNFFAFSAFTAGFSLMVVELIASRVLAPMVGSSIYTWTSAIGIILLGLVCGNFAGGFAADKYSSRRVVFYAYLFSAFSVALIPWMANFSRPLILLNFPLPLTTLTLTGLIFFIPSFFLGAIYPGLYKLFVTDLFAVGKSSAAISALWSAGSILGTFFTGFFFISHLGSSHTLYLISFILLLNGLFIKPLQAGQRFLFVFLAFAVMSGLNLSLRKAAPKNLVFEKESAYYKIKILDSGAGLVDHFRIMFLDFDVHSLQRTDQKNLELYTQMPMIFPTLNHSARNILVIGGGSEAISKNFSLAYPTAQVTTVEIDPAVVEASQKYFTPSQRPLDTQIADGRVFLEKTPATYDLIFSDAFNSFISVPWHLSTRQFNELAFNHLNESGIYAVNFISAQAGENSLFFQSMLKTFKLTFPNFQIFAYGKTPAEPQNIVLVGIKSADKLSAEELREALSKAAAPDFLGRALVTKPEKIFLTAETPILTDDFAPTENLMAPLIGNYFSEYSALYSALLN